MSNAQTIWQFLAGKGLTPPQIAGIMGNLQVESSLDPTAFNANEGAIGIAQWEGGRRTALQEYAQQHGGSETDLNTQLNFMWAELNGPELPALNAIRGMSDPTQVAAAWDGQYERSSGSTRQQRVSNAQSYMSAFQGGGVGALDSVSGATRDDNFTPNGGPQQVGSTKITAQQYADNLGLAKELLQGVPELNSLLQQALNDPKGEWTQETFLQKVHESKWWQQHNDAARQLLGLKYADVAQYNTEMTQYQNQIRDLAGQLGISLNGAQVSSLSMRLAIEGWSNADLQRHLMETQNYNKLKSDNGLQGQMAQTVQQLQQAASDYGQQYTWGPNQLAYWGQQILEGHQTLDTYTQKMRDTAKSMFPGLSTQIDGGMTVKDLASPYIQTMSNLLEMNPNSITLNDPTIRRALQGTQSVTDGKSTVPVATPLWQFEQQVRSDPRWANTNNAMDTVSSSLLKVGRDWGFEG